MGLQGCLSRYLATVLRFLVANAFTRVSDPTALKCVAGLPNPTAEYGMACNTFLSGGYDGIVRCVLG
jgi:hypothetical protein